MQAFPMTHSYSMELVALWHLEARIQTGLKGVVQIQREFFCRWLFSISKSACRNTPDTDAIWGRCIRGGIAVGYAAFLHFPLKFLLLVTVRQSVVDEMTQDGFSTLVECWLLLCHYLSPTTGIFTFAQRLFTQASQLEPACMRHHLNEHWSSKVPFSHK